MNISTIAKASGVSVATVSRILNHEDGVSEDVRRKTLEVIERSGYKPRENVRRGTRIAVVLKSDAPVADGFFARVLAGVTEYAAKTTVETSLVYYTSGSMGGTVSLADVLRRKRCNGAVMLSPLEDSDVVSIKQARIPIVLIACRREEEGIGYIDCDCFKGSYEQTSYLLRLGHRHIGFLAGQLDGNVDHQERLGGFQKAMREAGLTLDPGMVIEHHAAGLSELAGYNQARTLLDAHPETTAIFANNDSMAYGAICQCAERGMRVPEDISVVGYDDNSTSRFFNPPLTTTRQSLQEMGYDAALAIDLTLKGQKNALPCQILENELIVRKSCAPPRRT